MDWFELRDEVAILSGKLANFKMKFPVVDPEDEIDFSKFGKQDEEEQNEEEKEETPEEALEREYLDDFKRVKNRLMRLDTDAVIQIEGHNVGNDFVGGAVIDELIAIEKEIDGMDNWSTILTLSGAVESDSDQAKERLEMAGWNNWENKKAPIPGYIDELGNPIPKQDVKKDDQP